MNNSSVKIYRNTKLDRWATYKPLIVPTALHFRERVINAIDNSPSALRTAFDAIDEFTYKHANS